MINRVAFISNPFIEGEVAVGLIDACSWCRLEFLPLSPEGEGFPPVGVDDHRAAARKSRKKPESVVKLFDNRGGFPWPTENVFAESVPIMEVEPSLYVYIRGLPPGGLNGMHVTNYLLGGQISVIGGTVGLPKRHVSGLDKHFRNESERKGLR